ncbi:MAG TPA: alanine--tRNA ligase [Anaerohalosphaeraceae bacterium]|nr:alanine--tRNA ligase [Phycisphaerae bacterium]HOL30781.1 alanine--tRNA ligase [Anaerohalosphaeraceae bacterium]HOM76645.1 alanine--tRNA ligase [Anaerohalosphaeraceae bacterium]HPC63708.1 alanine--tRNA ligase [Anaerohalosphaeraceae bacterium]HPO69811.1 alanine--tRNA ligase [Anaerohalosphaeraceae bacterium]
MVLSSKDIRSGFIEFFKGHNHLFIPSWPVVPIGDETLLFTNAGMNQFKEYFLGHRTPSFKRAVNSQKCIRVSGKHNDLEEVGLDTYHHTFFEMLGNWSFDDYFKAESIEWAWQLLTGVYGIAPDRLWATVFAGDKEDNAAADTEAAELWTKLTPLPKERVLFCGRKDNFWEMGNTGPCGPCSEIHIDLGPDRCDMKHIPGHRCAVNAGCSRFIELWNLVFIQFNRKPDGRLERLSANYVDTGAGLERITAVLQNKRSNYDTDLFLPIIQSVEQIAGRHYTSQLGNKTDNAFRVIADHIRTLTFAIADGVNPSNEGRGYVMRRLLRRACRFGRSLNLHEPFMYKLVDVVVDNMGQAFPEIRERREFVASVIQAEEASFGRTLDRGLEIFANAAKDAKNGIISGQDAFQLYDTYGFPLDLTQLMAREQGLTVDIDEFERLMTQQRQRARAAQKTGSLAATLTGVELPETDDSLKYETETCRAKLLGWINDDGFTTKGELTDTEHPAALVLDKTCFYAESGGQVGDCGIIKTEDAEFCVETTDKIADCVLHRGRLLSGSLWVGDQVQACVDKSRLASRKNHTATHILQWALQTVLGQTVKQQGSLVCPDYLRFDFTWPKALTKEQIQQVEALVQDKIEAALPVTTAVMDIDRARQLGAMALFGEKYGQQVRVLAIGASDKDHIKDAFSKEFCGGTHVSNTAEIGGFAIQKEESISAGVRRITALTGPGLMRYLLDRSRIADELVELLKVPADQIVQRIGKLVDENKTLKKELKSGVGKSASDAFGAADKLLESAQKAGEAFVVVGQLPSVDVEQARAAVDSIKKKARCAAIVFGMVTGDNKVMLLAGVTEDLIQKGLKAGDIVKEIAPIVGGGGGGKPNMAQAGGKEPDKLDQALERAKQIITAHLG